MALSDFLGRPEVWAVSHALQVQWNSLDTDGQRWVSNSLTSKSPEILKSLGAETKDEIKSRYSCPHVHIRSPGDPVRVQVVLIYYLGEELQDPWEEGAFPAPLLGSLLCLEQFLFCLCSFCPSFSWVMLTS